MYVRGGWVDVIRRRRGRLMSRLQESSAARRKEFVQLLWLLWRGSGANTEIDTAESYSRDETPFQWFSHHHRSAPAVACRIARIFMLERTFMTSEIKFNDRWLKAVKTIYCDCLFLLFSERFSWKHDGKAAFRLSSPSLAGKHSLTGCLGRGVSDILHGIDWFSERPNSDWAHRRASNIFLCCFIRFETFPND